jgi:hypothetical protein
MEMEMWVRLQVETLSRWADNRVWSSGERPGLMRDTFDVIAKWSEWARKVQKPGALPPFLYMERYRGKGVKEMEEQEERRQESGGGLGKLPRGAGGTLAPSEPLPSVG